MLTHIVVKHFAIVDYLELSLDAGMTVLTGETGAGKSILIDALGLALGDRADSDVVRHGCSRAEINASFSIDDHNDAQAWLKEHDLDDDDNCIIRRTIPKDGRSKGYINGTPVPMQLLRELGEKLIDIHGQHEHQSLMRPGMQRQMLDEFGEHQPLLQELQTIYQQWRDASDELAALTAAASERASRIDFLEFQVTELSTLNPQDDEFTSLEAEHKRLANLQTLQQSAHSILASLSEAEQGSAEQLLSQAASTLQPLVDVDDKLDSIATTLNDALANVEDAGRELRHYLDSLESDPSRFDEVEQRLSALIDVARKHHTEPDKLPELFETLQTELQSLQHSDTQLQHLQSAIDDASKQYRKVARQLSSKRKTTSTRLAKQVTDAMQELGMQGGIFEVALGGIDDGAFSPAGMERIEFMVSANPGQPLKPLNKVASGGELSRISLAIQVASAHTSYIPTLIFDEVDVGIGGGVAEIVGQQLKMVGHSRQVMCVTHLAQVASQAQQHLHVSKSHENDSTATSIQQLDEPEREQEIARMLGGVEITPQTLAHAKEMLDNACRADSVTSLNQQRKA